MGQTGTSPHKNSGSRGNSFRNDSRRMSNYASTGDAPHTSSFFIASTMPSSTTNYAASTTNRHTSEMDDYYEYVEDTEDNRALKAHVNNNTSTNTSVTTTSNPNPLLTNPHKKEVPPPKGMIQLSKKPNADGNKKNQLPSKNGKGAITTTTSITTSSNQTPSVPSLVNKKDGKGFPPSPATKRKADSQPQPQLNRTSPPTVPTSNNSHPYHYDTGDDDEEITLLVLPGSITSRGSGSYVRRATSPLVGGEDRLAGSGSGDESWSMFSDTELVARQQQEDDSSDASPRAQAFKNFFIDNGSSSPKAPPPKTPLGNSILKNSTSGNGTHSPTGPSLAIPAHRSSRDGLHRTSVVAFSETVEVKPKKPRRGSAGGNSRSSLSAGSAGRRAFFAKFHKLQPISSTYELGRKLSNSSSFVTSSITMEGMAAEEAKVYELLYNKMDRTSADAAPPPLLSDDAGTGLPPMAPPPKKMDKPKVNRNYQNPDNIDPESLTNYVYKSATPMPQPDPKGPITNVYHEGEVKIPLMTFLGFEFAQCERVTTPVGMDLDIHSDEEESQTQEESKENPDANPNPAS